MHLVIYAVAAILLGGGVTGLAVSRGKAAPEASSQGQIEDPPMSADVAPRFTPDWWYSEESACPPGTRFVGAVPPEGYEAWCETEGRIRKGPHVRWHTNGRKAFMGQYVDGVLHGTVTEWWSSGQRARQGDYRAGLRHGAWTHWSRDGEVTARRDH